MDNGEFDPAAGVPVQGAIEADVAIVGAGMLGLFNALQYAKRGLRVVIVDNLSERKESYKVGESMLLFTNAFLRTIGGVEPFLSQCFPKRGVWMTHGTEGAQSFAEASEWGAQADFHPPHYLYDQLCADKWSRCMFLDMQMVRPELERFMCEQVRSHPQITLCDSARVRDVLLGEGSERHTVLWSSSRDQVPAQAGVRWVLDCSGRNRLLARKLKHAVDLDDGFQTTAAWGQFSGVTDELFGERWVFQDEDGDRSSRDYFTVHMWGEGYWIWVIRLGGDRISIGVTWDQRTPPPGASLREKFWDVMRRHPVLDGLISEQTLLEFRSYRDVQHLTDTFVSERRYGMVGDAASIIDAYYSQGISLAMVTSWHIANIVERDVREGRIDQEYIDRVNDATAQDWQIMRNMVREKYSPAIADSRFFALSHLLDFVVLFASGPVRADLVRWLIGTEGDSSRETPELRAIRERLARTLYFSQTRAWRWLSPTRVQAIQRALQAAIAERARFRLEHGIGGPTLKTIVGFTKPLPPLWRLPLLKLGEVVTLSALDVVKSGGASWIQRLPISLEARLRWVIRVRHQAAVGLFAALYAYDWAETAIHRLRAARPAGRTVVNTSGAG